MAYTIEIRPRALEFIRKRSKKHREQIRDRIESLKTDPRPPNASQLQGHPNLLRIRSGDYRIIYTVEDDVLTVTVVTVGDRKNVYEKLKRLLD